MKCLFHFSRVPTAFCRHLIYEQAKKSSKMCIIYLYYACRIRSERANPCFFIVFRFAWVIIWQELCTSGNFYKKRNVIIQGHVRPLLSPSVVTKSSKAVFFWTIGVCVLCLCMPLNQLIQSLFYVLVHLCFPCNHPAPQPPRPAPHFQAPDDSV